MNMKIVLGIIGLAISMIVFPIIMDVTATILAHASLASFTGLEALVKVTPLLAWVGLIVISALSAMSGFKEARSGGRSRARR